PLAAEEARLDAPHTDNVVRDRFVEGDETPRVDAQALARVERHLDDRSAAVDEALAVAFELLQDEAFAAEEPRADLLRERDIDVHVADRAEKRVLLTEH